MQDTVKENSRMEAIQALRAIAFLGIFLSHSKLPIAWSALGVSIFFVMSGFLMVYTYAGRDVKASLVGNIKFSYGKIKKLYPLHIITMLCAVLLFIVPHILKNTLNTAGIKYVLEGVVFNATLTQTWVPKIGINVSLNGVAWYLSVTAFLYFMFPYIMGFIKNAKRYIIGIVITLLFMYAVSMVILYAHGHINTSENIFLWGTYCFPLYRLGDFFIGCLLGTLFATKKDKKIGVLKSTILEITIFVVAAAIVILKKKSFDNFFINALVKNDTLLYIPVAAGLVWLFAKAEGIITRTTKNKIFVWIGNISAQLFLIHYVVINYAFRILTYKNVEFTLRNKIIIAIINLCLSIVASVLYMKIEKKIKDRKIKN